MRARLATLILVAAGTSLGGCAYGGLGGLSVGTGYGSPYGYGYGSQYGSPYGYGGYGSPYGYGGYGSPYGYGGYGSPYGYGGYGGYSPYYGWHDGYYYPGTGYYVYDRDRRRRQMTEARAPPLDAARRRSGRCRGPRRPDRLDDDGDDQPVGRRPPRLRPNWSDFDRGTARAARTGVERTRADRAGRAYPRAYRAHRAQRDAPAASGPRRPTRTRSPSRSEAARDPAPDQPTTKA